MLHVYTILDVHGNWIGEVETEQRLMVDGDQKERPGEIKFYTSDQELTLRFPVTYIEVEYAKVDKLLSAENKEK